MGVKGSHPWAASPSGERGGHSSNFHVMKNCRGISTELNVQLKRHIFHKLVISQKNIKIPGLNRYVTLKLS